MAATVYCKKCDRDYPVSEICPRCGAKLGRNAARIAWWFVDHQPVKDWMCWNAAMRIILPLGAVLLALILLLEGIAGGWHAVEQLLRSGLVFTLLWMIAVGTLALLGIFLMQGEDILECAVDSRGVHMRKLLADPTPARLLIRFRSPRMMNEVVESSDRPPMVCIAQYDLAWKDVARVQLWPEKTMILFYAPRWWMRVYLPCTAYTYPDALAYIREKLGAKKKVILPAELVVVKPKTPAVRTTRRAPAQEYRPAPPTSAQDMSELLADIQAMNAEEEARVNREPAP